ncbi:MAG TPA: serine/threonine-protein kinase [Ktedonobacteraceae bacterium]|nr:serine/threonine-protein kinase [Ktedonobacteraceae bacterium]
MVDYIGRQLGNYRLTRLLGKGSFAQVYLGEHIYLGTPAAMKVLSTQMADDLDVFRTEARTIARLIHPNIVRVLEFGVEGTIPFLVLDYAPNGTLRQYYPKGVPLPLPTVVSYVKQIAEALAYAHGEKLIHRDVKPENILLGRNNELLLSDFGIALMAQTMHDQNMQNVAGTLAYMAPEQIQGNPRQASDQYSLGIIVYEWLTGERPFNGSFNEIISQQLSVLPRPLRAKVPTIAPAVEQVVLMALEKNPDRRFNNIRAFAFALELASQLNASASDVAGKPAGVGEISPSFSKPQGDERAAIAPTILPSPAPVSPANNAAPPTILPPPELLSPAKSEGPVVRPVAPPPSVPTPQTKPAGTLVSSYQGHPNEVCSLSWFSGGVRIVSVSNDKSVHVWDAMTGKQFQIYQDIADAVGVIAGSPDGSRIATAGSDAQVRIWDFATNRLVTTYRGHVGSTINAIAWSPTQQQLASAAADGTVHVWDATTGQTLTIYRGHTGSVNMLAWSPDDPSSARIVSGGDDASVQTWNASTGRSIALHRSQGAKVMSVAWSPEVYPMSLQTSYSASMPTKVPNSARVACGRADGTVQMWDTTTDREVLSYRYNAPLSVVAWSPDGRRFAYASENKTVEVWDTMTNLKLVTFSHAAPTRVMAWSPDGKYIASGGGDATIQVWVAP